MRLYSVDHADLYVTNERNETSAMLRGIPHSLLLSNSNGEMSVLVSAWPPCRPALQSVPFSTDLVLDRADKKWFQRLEHPYYMYPVHVSLSFLYSTTLASALYLLLLRYLHRQYKEVSHRPTRRRLQPHAARLRPHTPSLQLQASDLTHKAPSLQS